MVINYWNITNYQPFFNRDSHGMEDLKKEVGDKAACNIQRKWREVSKCCNACSDKSCCFGVMRYFKCNHRQCRRTTMMIHYCIYCGCKEAKPTKENRKFLLKLGLIKPLESDKELIQEANKEKEAFLRACGIII